MNNIQNIYEESRYKILFNEFYPALVQFAFSFINNEDAAKDIVQEIFIRIWEKRIKFENELLLRKYLYLSTQNKCFTYLRDRKVQHYHKQQIIDNYQEQEEPNIINSLIKEEVYRQLLSSIEQLPPQCKKICLLTLDGKKPSEIAKELELNVETVKKQKKIEGYCLFSYQYLDCQNKKYHFDAEQFSTKRKKLLNQIVKSLKKNS